MGWQGYAVAELRFPPGGVETWKAFSLGKAGYRPDDWPSLIQGSVTDRTIAAELDELVGHEVWLRKQRTPTIEWVDSKLEGDRYQLRLWLNEDDFRAHAPEVATMLRLAERIPGASGLAVFGGYGIDESVVLRIRAGTCTLEDLSEPDAGWPLPQQDDPFIISIEVDAITSRAEEAMLEEIEAMEEMPLRAAKPKSTSSRKPAAKSKTKTKKSKTLKKPKPSKKPSPKPSKRSKKKSKSKR